MIARRPRRRLRLDERVTAASIVLVVLGIVAALAVAALQVRYGQDWSPAGAGGWFVTANGGRP